LLSNQSLTIARAGLGFKQERMYYLSDLDANYHFARKRFVRLYITPVVVVTVLTIFTWKLAFLSSYLSYAAVLTGMITVGLGCYAAKDFNSIETACFYTKDGVLVCELYKPRIRGRKRSIWEIEVEEYRTFTSTLATRIGEASNLKQS